MTSRTIKTTFSIKIKFLITIFSGLKQLLTLIDIYLGFWAPAKTFVNILKKSDHGLTVCARSGTSSAWGPCCFRRLRVKLIFDESFWIEKRLNGFFNSFPKRYQRFDIIVPISRKLRILARKFTFALLKNFRLNLNIYIYYLNKLFPISRCKNWQKRFNMFLDGLVYLVFFHLQKFHFYRAFWWCFLLFLLQTS